MAAKLKNLENKQYSIRFTVLTAFLFVASLIVVFALSLNYFFSIKIAEKYAASHFTEIAEKTSESVLQLERRAINLSYAMQSNLAVKETINDLGNSDLIRRISSLMHQNDGIFSLFIGYPNGDYLEVSNLDASESMRQIWNANEKDRWVVTIIQQVNAERIKKTLYLDKQLEIQRSEEESTDYFSYNRPWYRNASSTIVNKTLPYKLSFSKHSAISYSIKTDNDFVVGSISLLSSVEKILKNMNFPETSASYIFDSNGTVHSNQRSNNAKLVKSSSGKVELPHSSILKYANNQAFHAGLGEIELNSEPYYLFVSPIQGFEDVNRKEFIALLVSKQEVIKPYESALQKITVIMLSILLLLTPLISLVVNLIVKPIHRLIAENDKVSNRDFGNVIYVPTAIKELHELSYSLVSMSKSICAYEESQKELLDSFIKLIAQAIDDKSPYTGGHCERVPKLAMMLADIASKKTTGVFEDFGFKNEIEWREFQVAAWLHDCGKITTPEHIVDKGSKLEAIYNRIHEIRMRFEVLLRDAEIDYWKNVHAAPENETVFKAKMESRQTQIKEDFAFVAACNVGGEFMEEQHVSRLHQIAQQTWTRYLDNRQGLSPVEEQCLGKVETNLPQTEYVLADKPEHITLRDELNKYEDSNFTLKPPKIKQNLGEIYNLSIGRGTLTAEDRFIINEHIISTIRMLEALPLPPELSRVPEYAGGHHEAINGSGYPRGLTGESLSIPARIMAIADIFEALTAADRPYKKAKTLSQSLNILKFMAKDGHIDKELFKLFIESQTYLTYANQYLMHEQIDDVNIDLLLEDLA